MTVYTKLFTPSTESTLSWTINWKLSKILKVNDALGNRTEAFESNSELTLESLVLMQNRSLVSNRMKYTFGQYSFLIQPKKQSATEFDLVANGPKESPFKFVRNQARAWSLPGPVKTHLFPDQVKTYFKNADFLSIFEDEYETFIDSIYYLGPLRDHPRREYAWSGVSPSDVGRRGENTMAAILSATHKGEMRNLGRRTHYKPFQEIIAHWLKELGLIHDFKIDEIGQGANLYRALVELPSVISSPSGECYAARLS